MLKKNGERWSSQDENISLAALPTFQYSFRDTTSRPHTYGCRACRGSLLCSRPYDLLNCLVTRGLRAFQEKDDLLPGRTRRGIFWRENQFRPSPATKPFYVEAGLPIKVGSAEVIFYQLHLYLYTSFSLGISETPTPYSANSTRGFAISRKPNIH